ncbi:10505_t:CDS:2 [Racocetra persica]|uniref:10505_t:CDS:1 n=1 Tax=Racocetra persica TaxID=160502 RepID=A0ACA9NNL8_9GLOM|nr:10505_t:CDS:2 [Racocetra persica]
MVSWEDLLWEAERQLTKAYRALNDAKREMNACKCFEERNSEAIRREQQTRGAENRIRQLQQDNLEQKLSIKREDLERTIIDLGVSRDNKNEIRRNLCDAYERWLKVMERNGHNERDNCVKRA